jgi:hypothetical protein
VQHRGRACCCDGDTPFSEIVLSPLPMVLDVVVCLVARETSVRSVKQQDDSGNSIEKFRDCETCLEHRLYTPGGG